MMARSAGYDFAWIRELMPGADDEWVLSTSLSDERVLITFDKDFGDLARTTPLPKGCGIILFRTPMPPLAELGSWMASVLASRSDWAGHLSVVEPSRIRIRPLG